MAADFHSDSGEVGILPAHVAECGGVLDADDVLLAFEGFDDLRAVFQMIFNFPGSLNKFVRVLRIGVEARDVPLL
ncbi:MAG: hypothetical protein PHX68_02915 [Alphaproteobacteria bacterium]|nr:hypothetical protein [Alphaproteobacteria bacterium]